ncbi:Exopolyphosphatase [hydrothermal vent metagenome]|uniref:Exopolyphosphatase n=1 Tax=hydrothermal vent metagenome TaxID=652676 RepID=A0A3B0W1J3_9ZZZZ
MSKQSTDKSIETMPTENRDQSLYAAIDLGSNSFHMIIARETHGQFQVIDKHKEMVRLRTGLDKDGNLTDKAFQAGIECLERFGQRLKAIPNKNIRAVGTNTLRNAKNSQTFLKQGKQALGHSIKIISGQEEARLIYLGVSHGLPTNDDQRLVMDIGGGSTEYIIGQHVENSHLTSTEMGCISITQAFFSKGEITESKMNKAIAHCRQILRPHRSKLNKQGWDIAIGASGSIKAIGKIIELNDWNDSGITLKSMLKLNQKLIESNSIQNIKLEGLKDERRPVFAGGLAILIATFIELNIEQMQVSVNALREGLILDSLGRIYAEDIREISVKAMQKWMKVDTLQADHILNTAKVLHKQAKKTWELQSPDYDFKCLLKWAIMLHETGIAISYKRYQHHSAYLISQSDMAGFDQQEKQMLSALMLNHRGKFDTSIYNEIDESITQQLIYLTLILRLAVRIHRGRDFELTKPLLSIKNSNEIHLEFEDSWLKEHPLTQLDLETEAKHLNAIDFTLKLT